MYRHCIKYFCLAQLESVLANFNRQVDWPVFKTNIVFYISVILTLSVYFLFREVLPVALAQILSVSVRCASWP
jgi:hypothetical protein